MTWDDVSVLDEQAPADPWGAYPVDGDATPDTQAYAQQELGGPTSAAHQQQLRAENDAANARGQALRKNPAPIPAGVAGSKAQPQTIEQKARVWFHSPHKKDKDQYLRDLPPEERPAFTKAVEAERKKYQDREGGRAGSAPDPNLAVRMADHLRRGVDRTATNVERFGREFVGIGTEEEALQRQFQADTDSLSREGMHTRALEREGRVGKVLQGIEEGFLGATEQVPNIVGAIGATTLGGPGGATLWWYAQTAPELDSDLRRSGVDPETARSAAAVGALPIAAMEMLQIGQLAPNLKVGARQAIATTVRKFIADRAQKATVAFGTQMGEEFAQEVMEVGTKAAATYLDKNASGMDWESELAQSGQELLQAAKSMPFLMGPGQAIETAVEGQEAYETGQQRQARLAELQLERLRRIREKGFVTETEAKTLGLSEEEAKNRKSRMAVVKLKEREAEQELERAQQRETAPEAPTEQAPAPAAPEAPAAAEQPPAAPPSSRDDAKQEAVGLAELMAKKRAEATPAEPVSPPPAPTPPQNPPEPETAPATPVDEARVTEIIKDKWGGRSGNPVLDARRDEAARKQVAEEEEIQKRYPPGTTLKVKGLDYSYNRPQIYYVEADGRLLQIATRRHGVKAGAMIRNYKPGDVTVLSREEALEAARGDKWMLGKYETDFPAAPEPVPLSPREKAIQGKQPLRRDPTLEDEVVPAAQVQERRRENRRKGRRDQVVDPAEAILQEAAAIDKEVSRLKQESLRGKLNPATDAEKAAYQSGDAHSLTHERFVMAVRAAEGRFDMDASSREMHRQYVEAAIKEGKPVPPEVLAEYPDFVPKKMQGRTQKAATEAVPAKAATEREWESREGRRRIVGTLETKSGTRLEVATGDKKAGDFGNLLIPPNEIDRLIEVDELNAASEKERRASIDKREAAEAAEKAEREDLDGFAADAPPMKRGRIVKTLGRSVRFRGKATNKRDMIRTLVSEGRRLEGNRLLNENDEFLQLDTTTEQEYAQHLIDRKAASKAPTQPRNASAAETGPTVVPTKETLPEAVQEPEAGSKSKGTKDKPLADMLEPSGVAEAAAKQAAKRGDTFVTPFSNQSKRAATEKALREAGLEPVPDKLNYWRKATHQKGRKAPKKPLRKSPSVTDSNTISETPDEAASEISGKKGPKRVAKAGPSREANIVHETENLYAYRLDDGRISIRMHNGTHALVVGEQPDVETAKQTMERLERAPEQLREFMGALPKPKSVRKPKKPKDPQTAETVPQTEADRQSDFEASWEQARGVLSKEVDLALDKLINRHEAQARKDEGGRGIAVGAENANYRWGADAVREFRTRVRQGMDPEKAAEEVKALARTWIEKHNARRPKDINWKRWEGAADSFIDTAWRIVAQAESKTKLQQAASEALDDAHSEADKLLKKVKGKGLASNPMLDPEIIVGAGKVVYKYAKANFLQFAAFTEQLASDISQSFVDDLLPVLKSEWNKLHATGEFVGMTDTDGNNPVQPKAAAAPKASAKAASGDTTGTKHAKTDELRAKLGLGERVIPTTQTQEELDATAKQMMKDDPLLGSRLAAELYDSPRALEDPVLEHVMGRHIRDLENRREDGEDVADELAIAVQASERVGTLEGRVFRARQEVRAPDFSLPDLLNRHSETVKKEPSREEQAKYAELADQVKELEADKQKLQEQLVEEQVARQAAEAAKATPRAKLGTKKATLQKKADDAIANFKKAWAALGQMGIISDPKAEAEKLKAIERAAIDVVKVYAELGVNSAVEFMAGVAKAFKGITAKQKKAFQAAWDDHEKANPAVSPMGADPDKATLGARAKALTRAAVESGIEDWNAVIDAVHEQLAKEVPGFTRSQTMEAISDYGQYRMLSTDAIDTKVRAIRGKARQSLKLEDLNKAIVASRKWLDEGMSPEDVAQKLHDQDLLPKATGSERATPDSIERGLIAEFNRLKKELPVSTATREGQLKSAMSTAKTSARNRLEDYGKEIEALEEAIAKKVALEKTSDRVPLTPDAELADMQKLVAERRQKRDELKEQYETIFPPTKKQRQITAQQQTKRAEQAIDKLKQELKDLQSGKEKSTTQKPDLVPAQIQQQLQMWRERLKTARKASQEADAARWEDEGGAVMPPVGRKPLTDEQRLKMAEDMVRRQTEIVKADIKALEQGTWKPSEAGQSLTSETKEKLQQELEALKGIREQARKASPQYQAREEAKYWEQYRKNQEKQLEFWENRRSEAAAGILPQPRKKRTPTEKAILDKAIEIEAVQYRALAEIEKARRAQWNAGQWIGAGLNEATSTLPRNLMSGLEGSVVLRQGPFYTYSHPVLALKNFARSMGAAFSQRIALASMEDIKSRQNYPEYGPGGVEFTHHEGAVKDWEEMYSSATMRWLESTEGKSWLPLRTIAKAYMMSDRGFSNFRNVMAADTYDVLKRDTLAIRDFFSNHGLEPRPWGAEDVKVAGRSSSALGGRATGLKPGGGFLNWLLFARRFFWANIQREFIIPFQMATPQFIGQWNADPAMRIAHAKLYAQFMVGAAAHMTALFWLLYLLSDDDDDKPTFGWDWRSTDFLKPKVGETRYDVLGGMQQPIVMLGRFWTGESMGPDGKITKLYSDGMTSVRRDTSDVLIQWGRGKLGPGPSGILDWFAGQNLLKQPKTKADVITERIQPMTYRELWQAEQELGLKRGTVTFLEGFIGTGVNTYGPRTNYRNASESGRLEMVEKDLEGMQWDDPPEPAYAEFLTEDQLQAFRDRRSERRTDVLIAATYDGENEKTLKTRDKNIGFLQEMKAEGVSLAEAEQLLKAHYYEPTDKEVAKAKRENREPRNSPMTAGERPGYNAKLRKLRTLYGE
jgi:hypothetical protein